MHMRIGGPELRWIFLVVVLGVFARDAGAQSGELAIVDVSVIDPAAGVPQPDMTVIIRDGTIVTVSRSRDAKVSTSAQKVDGTGKYLLPAFWDMHTHFRDVDRDLKMDVANGVLGIR